MRIAVIGANSSIGHKVVLKAESAGIKVTSIVTSFDDIVGNGKLIIKPYDSIQLKDVEDCHYVVDVVSFMQISKFSSELLPIWHLLEILKDSQIKLLEFGSSSFLYTDSTRTKFVAQQDAVVLDEAQNKIDLLCLNAYKRLRLCSNVQWSVLCPPLLLDEYIYGTGKYEFSSNILPVGLQGDSSISENDFVLASIELLKMIPPNRDCVSVRGIRD